MTLVEILVVISLIGIALGLALPSYRQYVMRGHRAEAIRIVHSTAACLERNHARRGSYDTGLCDRASGNGHYRITIEPDSESSASSFTITAMPTNAQSDDPCGGLVLDHTGARTITGPAEDSLKCWSGR